jgi:hypothetical protein
MLKREISDGQGSKGFMLKKETVVYFIMSLEVHRNFPAKVGAIGDSVLPVKGGGEHCNPGAARGRVEINAFRAAPEVCRLENRLVGGLRRRVNKGIGKVVIVPEIGVRHVDVNIIRPNRDGEVFLIERLKLRIRSRQEGISRECVLLRSQRDEVIRSGIDVILEHELLGIVVVILVKGSLSIGGSIDRHRHHKPADVAIVGRRETEVAEEGANGAHTCRNRIAVGIGHRGSGIQMKARVRSRSSRSREGGGERR